MLKYWAMIEILTIALTVIMLSKAVLKIQTCVERPLTRDLSAIMRKTP